MASTNVNSDPVVWSVMMAAAVLIGLCVFLSLVFTVSATARDRSNGAVGGFFLVIFLMICLPIGGCVVIKFASSQIQDARPTKWFQP